MRATAAPVDGNRVRLSVEIDKSEIDEALDATAKRLGRQVKIPGFRPGRVPRRVLEARMGGAVALRQQAISDALPDLYARAVQDTDITAGEDEGPVTFNAVDEVRPTVSIPGYAGLVVTVPRIDVTDEDIDVQIDRLRDQSGELTVVGRAAQDGDFVTIDLHGSRPDGEDIDVEDYLYEVGSGSDIAGLDDQLRGAKTGDILQFAATFPGAPPGDADGAALEISASIRVLVKEVKEKVLPAVTDEWAAEASEFDTVAALRADLRTRLGQVNLSRAQMAFRERALAALVALVADDPPEPLVDTEVRERLHDLGHRLETRGLTLERFLQASGRDEASLLAEIRAQASDDVRADLALRALAEEESLDVSDDELEETLADMAEQMSTNVAELRRRLDRTGRLPAVRSDRRKAKALVWLLDNVEVVDEDGATVDREVLRNEPGVPPQDAQQAVGEAQDAVSAAGNVPEDQGSED